MLALLCITLLLSSKTIFHATEAWTTIPSNYSKRKVFQSPFPQQQTALSDELVVLVLKKPPDSSALNMQSSSTMYASVSEQPTLRSCPFACMMVRGTNSRHTTRTPQQQTKFQPSHPTTTTGNEEKQASLAPPVGVSRSKLLVKTLGRRLCKAVMLTMAKTATRTRHFFYQSRWSTATKNKNNLQHTHNCFEAVTKELYDKSCKQPLRPLVSFVYSFFAAKESETDAPPDSNDLRHVVAQKAGEALMYEVLRVLLDEQDPTYDAVTEITTVFATNMNLPAYTVSTPNLRSVRDIPTVTRFSQVIAMQFERTYDGILAGHFSLSASPNKATQKLAKIHKGLNISDSMFTNVTVLLMTVLDKISNGQLDDDSRSQLRSMMGNSSARDGVVAGSGQ